MELNIRRIPIAFKDLYPDPAVRHQLHYAFAHQFIPKLVFGDLEEFFRLFFLASVSSDPTDFIHRAWKVFEDRAAPPRNAKERANRSIVIRKITELDIRFVKAERNLFGLITMPPPEQPAQAFLVGVALIGEQQLPDNTVRKAVGRIFTLEATVDGANGTGVFCEWTDVWRRINYGVKVQTNVSAFCDAITVKLQLPVAIPALSTQAETPGPATATETKDRYRTCPACARRIGFRGPVHGAEYVIPLAGFPDHLIARCSLCSADLVLKGGELGRIGSAFGVYKTLSTIPILAVLATYVALIALMVGGALKLLNTKHWATVALISSSFAGALIAAVFAIVRGLHTGVVSSPNITLMPGDDRFRSREPESFWKCLWGWVAIAGLAILLFIETALGKF